jgi:hypothetical protein
MRAVIKLEFIGENYHAYKRSGKFHEPTERYGEYLGFDQSRPWVKRISGYDEEKMNFIGDFVKGQIDYSQSNSTGSRGVYLYYPLKEGIYEVNERKTWTRVRRYFTLVVGSEMVEIDREEVEQWLLQQKEA